MNMTIHPVHRRMAELWTYSRKRLLTDAERLELDHCLQANAKLVWGMACLENASLAASLIGDIEWQHEICRDIENYPHTSK